MKARAEYNARHKASVEGTLAFLEQKCKSKIAYPTEVDAGRAIVRIRASKGPSAAVQTAYPCDHTGVRHWHLTHHDAERSDLARQIAETRRAPAMKPMKPMKPEPDVPDEKIEGMGLPSKKIQEQIVARYRRGVSTDDLALDFLLHERLVIRILVDAGYAISLAQEQHRREGFES
jgi:hypothetical protein